MKKHWGAMGRSAVTLAVMLLILALSACGGGGGTTTPSSSDSGSQMGEAAGNETGEKTQGSEVEPKGKIYISYPSIPDLGDVTTLLAWEEMGRMGYEVIPKFMAESGLSVEAVLRGDAQIGLNTGEIYAAIDKGAPLSIVFQVQRNEWSLIGRGDVKTLEDLDGRRLAQHSVSASAKIMTDSVLALKAPNVKPNTVYITGSENRADALLRDQVDAAAVDLLDLTRLKSMEPGKFHTVSSFAEDLSDLAGVTMFVTKDYLEKNKDVVKDAIRALLTVHQRAAKEPDYIYENAPKYLPNLDPELLKEAAKLYIELDEWPVKGGLNEEMQEFTVDFYTKSGALENNVPYEEYHDRGALDEVLAEMGL